MSCPDELQLLGPRLFITTRHCSHGAHHLSLQFAAGMIAEQLHQASCDQAQARAAPFLLQATDAQLVATQPAEPPND